MIESIMTPQTMVKIEAIAKEVAAFQLKHFHTIDAGGGDVKASMEFVSFVDVESEKIIKKGLMAIDDSLGFYGEETGRTGNGELEWVVDPLDGTTNFLSGINHFSISIALVSKGEVLMGLIMKPSSNEIFTAIKGQGAYLNGERLANKPTLDPSRALIATGFPYRSIDLEDQFYACTKEVLRMGRGVRRMGSAALDLAYLSAGYLQGYWEQDLQPYDIAAGMLLLTEVGCPCTNQDGKP